MPSSLSAAMEEEMRLHPDRVHPVVELTLGSTVYKFAENAVASESIGVYLPYVSEFGDTTRSANVAEFTLESPTFNFSIFDRDRVLQKLFGGPLRGAIKNSKVETWWRSFHVAASNHYRDFVGIVLDYDVTDRIYRFRTSADTFALARPVQIPYVPEQDWPDAPEKTIGAPLWIVLGKHSSIGVEGSLGMIECLPALEQTNGNVDVWIVSLGDNFAVPRVFFDGTLRSSDFTVGTAQRGKNYYQTLTYIGGNPHPTRDSDIRCDVDGLTTSPNGTGTLITNPAEQMRLVLRAFVFGSGDTRPLAAWPSEVGKPIASSVWDAARQFYKHRGWVGTMVVRAGETGLDVLSRGCSSGNAAPFFADTWGVGARPRDNGERTLYYDSSHHIAQNSGDARSPLSLSTERTDPVTDLQVDYHLDDSRGAYAKSARVAWRRSGIQIREEKYQISDGKREL